METHKIYEIVGGRTTSVGEREQVAYRNVHPKWGAGGVTKIKDIEGRREDFLW